jgi:Hydrazine synthase alpha subunit middle domain
MTPPTHPKFLFGHCAQTLTIIAVFCILSGCGGGTASSVTSLITDTLDVKNSNTVELGVLPPSLTTAASAGANTQALSSTTSSLDPSPPIVNASSTLVITSSSTNAPATSTTGTVATSFVGTTIPSVAAPLPANIGASAILFVTSVPSSSFRNQLNTFSNHKPGVTDALAGGDLYLRYGDGTLRNLTLEAGWGVPSGQIQGGAKAISVRQPTVHWDGTKAIFSMLVGGATQRYANPTRLWQMYEVTGLGVGQTAVITKVAKQPNYNNVSPIYGSDDQILFTSDAPLYGMTHTYPQLDEYESSAVVTGIWKLNPATGKTKMIEHAPSGAFDLFLDSFGRLLFTKWEHLKRDQQADLTRYYGSTFNPYDFADESPAATKKVFSQYNANNQLQADNKGVLYDVFPEARDAKDLTKDPNETINEFNQFFIWQINEDGSEEETINHAGRNEFGGMFMFGVFLDDPLLNFLMGNFSANAAMRATFRGDAGIFQLREDSNTPGKYYGTYAQEFSRHAAGRIVEFSLPPGMNPETMVMKDYTNATLDNDPNGTAPALASMTGHYRNPLKLADNTWVVSHTPEYRMNAETSLNPLVIAPRYVLQLKSFAKNPMGTDFIAGALLTGGLNKNILAWTDLASPVNYNGPLNEHDMVELRPRARPQGKTMKIDPIEKIVLDEESVDESALRAWMVANNLALIVTRNMTMRDRADTSQPFNLNIPGGVKNVPVPTVNGKPSKVYDIQDLQIFQGDLTRAYASSGGNPPGRRVYSKPIHNSAQQPKLQSQNIPNPTGPAGSVKIGLDGSMAAFVPAGRALTWQVTSPTGKPVIRERNWLTFAPGEIRTCASCHGVNSSTHNNLAEPINKPQALRDLMTYWKTLP